MKNEIENRFALTLLQIVKETIIKNKKPLYNPIYIYGATKNDRFEMFWRTFNKDFNKLYKEHYKYISCKNMSIDDKLAKDKKMIILEEIDCLADNDLLQKKVYNWITDCIFETNAQIIICSNEYVDDLDLDEHFKARIKSGISTEFKK